jgi:hypothetical protein
MRFRVLFLCLALALASGTAYGQQPAVAGVVVDDSTGTPIAAAQVTITPGPHRVSSDTAGRFRFERLAPGGYVIEVGAIGYARVRGALNVAAEGSTVEIRMTPAPIALGEVVVEAASTTIGWAGTGFERRRSNHSGSGQFLDRQQLERREASTLPDIFRGIPGIRIFRDERDSSMYAASGSHYSPGGRPCLAQVFIDGIFQSGRPVDLRGYPPESLEAVEYYRHPSSTPVEFRVGSAQCGTLVLWTRQR